MFHGLDLTSSRLKNIKNTKMLLGPSELSPKTQKKVIFDTIMFPCYCLWLANKWCYGSTAVPCYYLVNIFVHLSVFRAWN